MIQIKFNCAKGSTLSFQESPISKEFSFLIMASRFLINKWRRLFQTFDFKKKGLLSIEDANVLADKYIKSQKLTGKAAADYKTGYVDFFITFFLKGSTQINEDQMVAAMTKQYNMNKQQFEKITKEQYAKLVHVTDIDSDNKISREEIKEALNAMGLHNFDEKYFAAYPTNGTIDANLFLDSWVQYVCNSDENNVSQLEKARLYGFRMIDNI